MNKISLLTPLRQQLLRQQHRALVILSGSKTWQQQQLHNLWTAEECTLWLSSPESHADYSQLHSNIEPIQTHQLPHILGQETDSVVIDVNNGLNANALGITSGMIRAGGLLILLTPDEETWRTLVNPDNQRFLNSPYQIEQALPYFTEHLISQWHSSSSTPAVWIHETHSETAEKQLELALHKYQHLTDIQTELKLPTLDQQKAIEAIYTVAFGHRKRPLVINADRGRGKSSALGLAAIECLMQGKAHVVLTASRIDQAKMAFTHALSAINDLSKTGSIKVVSHQVGRIIFELNEQQKTFEFIAPDQLILEPTRADLLMVDEAAHLPTPLLTQLLQRHHRMVFATTLHGYEGSGRGFELRFKKTLNQLTPDWKNLLLKQPIRWADHDPLEQAINQALFLSPGESEELELPLEAPEQDFVFSEQDIQLKQIKIESLLHNTNLFHALFDLLVQAHYQTSPNDLQQLLSVPNLKIIIAQNQKQLVGVVLCIAEGKIKPSTEHVHGHLVPQLLLKNYAQADFVMLSSWRIMRIAVDPKLQRSGIGKALLTHLHSIASQAKIDYLSSSFGASEELLPFWFEQNYKPVHVGVKRDKSSGSHNLVVAQAITPMAQQALATIQRTFQSQFPHVLMESLPHLGNTMVLAILQSFRFGTTKPLLEEGMLNYRSKQRSYESVSGLLWEWTIRYPQHLNACNVQLQEVWCDKVLKKRPWQTVAQKHNLAGRKGVEAAMIEMLQEVSLDKKEAASRERMKSNFGNHY